MSTALAPAEAVQNALEPIGYFFARPARLVRSYSRDNLRADSVAALTVGVVLLPQAIAFALIAELPPEMGLYAAIVGAIVGGLWGSSNQIHTGPTNAISLLVLSSLQSVYVAGSPEFIVAAGVLAVMAGVFQLALGLLRLGVLVNFVSHSVIVGFASGAGLLIVLRQLKPLLGLQFDAETIVGTVVGVVTGVPNAPIWTAAIGIGSILVMVVLRKLSPRMPAALLTMALSALIVFLLSLDEQGVSVIGELPRNLPPLAELPLFNMQLIQDLSAGALAVGAIGLVETLAIGRSIATQTNQRIDSNQEFVGQGLANITAGFFSGYPVAGSFSRSAVNFSSGARTPIAAILSSLVVVAALFLIAPAASYLPRSALAGVLIVIGFRMIDRTEIARILQGPPGDAVIMVVTFLGTIFLHIETAVLIGILLSLVVFLLRTSTPRVHTVVPDDKFRHFVYRPDKPVCPQLGVVDILGDLYFGAVNHVEEAIYEQRASSPQQRYLLLRMHNVNHIDFSGIHMLENVVASYRDQGGDVFMLGISYRVNKVMESTGFISLLGDANILDEDEAISHLFYRVLDPAICIYECQRRVFRECQNLPKRTYFPEVALDEEGSGEPVPAIAAKDLWKRLHSEKAKPPLVVDVREPREYHQGHIPGAQLIPLPELAEDAEAWWDSDEIVFVCRSGRRSERAARILKSRGCTRVKFLEGGILAWEAADLLEAVD